MARTFFLLLLLLNALMLAWIYLKGDERISAGREPLRTKAEMAADKIRLLPPADSPPAALAAMETTAVSAPAAIAAESCRAFSGATVAEAQEIVKAWSEKLTAAHISANPIPLQQVFDIVIPDLASRTAAELKLTELKKLGVGDGIQIRAEDNKHFSVYIATFAERNAAEEALKSAAKKGVRSAIIAQRQAAVQQSTIEVRGSDAILKPLAELASARNNLISVECATR